MPSAGATEEDRELVPDELAPPARGNGWAAGETRYYWLLPAEHRLKRRLFGSMVRLINELAVAIG